MKALFTSLCLLIGLQASVVHAQGWLRGDPTFRNGGYWEFGYQHQFGLGNQAPFYIGNHQPWYAPPIRTEFISTRSEVQRIYFRNTVKLDENWFTFFQMDMGLHSFGFGSREYAPDGSIFRLDHYASALEQYIQMGMQLGVLYKKPLHSRLFWRAGAHGGMMMSLFEKSWDPQSLFLDGFNGSVRPALGLEAALEWQITPKHNNLYLIGGYAFNHAFKVEPEIISQGLATHHGFQAGLRIGLKSRKKAERRSDIIGF